MSNRSSNRAAVPEAKSALDKFKYEVASELGVQSQLHLLGYRKDVLEIYHSADVFCFPSIREGLSVSLMEAMASGLPVACAKIRGNIDLIDADGGVLFNSRDVEECKKSIRAILAGDAWAYGMHNAEKVKQFSVETVNKQMTELYDESIC